MATPATARLAEERINAQQVRIKRLRDNADGIHAPLPFHPDKSDPAHLNLREQAALPVLRLAVQSITGRLALTGYHSGDAALDKELGEAWQAERMDGAHRAAIEDSLVVGAGVVSVWPNNSDPAHPYVVVEDPAQCWHEPAPSGRGYRWAAKLWSRTETVNPRAPREITVPMITVYEPDKVTVFVKRGGRWVLDEMLDELGEPQNPMPNPFDGHLPLVQIAPDRDPRGMPRSWVEALIPAARAIDTMRFDMVLAAHASAFRQLFISGYDPVQRDENGIPLFVRNADGSPLLDPQGNPVPVLRPPHAGVDNIITFTDPNTKLDSIPPADLSSYTKALDYLLVSFAGVATIPVTDIGGAVSNVSGDALEAAAMAQTAMVTDFQRALSEDFERVYDLMALAMGKQPVGRVAEVEWAPPRLRNLAQVASFISLTVPNGVPASVGLEMIPGATPQTVAKWLANAPATPAAEQPPAATA